MAKVSLILGNNLGNHQAQAQAFESALLAAGLLQVPTAGELDMGAGDFTSPLSSSSSVKTYGFRVYKTPEDGLGAPLYLRFTYLTRFRRRFSTSVYYHDLHFTINVFTEAQLSNQLTSSNINTSSVDTNNVTLGGNRTYICVKPGYVGIVIKADLDQASGQDWMAGGFAIASRTKDRDGNFTADGWLALDTPSITATANTFGIRRSIGGMPTNYHSDGCTYFYLNGLAPMSEGAVQLQFPMTVSQHMHPFEEFGMYYNPSSMAVGEIIQAEVGGIPREYVVLGQAGLASYSIGATTVNKMVGFAMLWED